MSKQTFSEKINEVMKRKINALEHADLNELFKKDEEFEFILSLAYMTLSKEKIIKKDEDNKDRLGRLTQLVEQKEIDNVFDPNIISKTPNVISTLENNNTWILDNIRDSIMHGTFDIDEENKLILTDNNQHDRDLKTEIPFSWFIEYAKNDILNKKISNEYTVKAFYNKNYKKDSKNNETIKEIRNNILYNIKVSGITFNINEMENRIKELYKKYSKDEYDNSLLEKYKEKLNKFSGYNKKYLLSFYLSSKKVKATLEKEYPGIEVKVTISNKNEKLINKIIKNCPARYINYDFMIEDFNKIISKKGINLLNYLEKFITEKDKYANTDFSDLEYIEKSKIINELIRKKKLNEKLDIKQLCEQNIKVLKSLFLNIYGIATLVINQENIYNGYFLDKTPEEYNISAMDKQTYKDLADLKRKLEIEILEKRIILPQIESQYNNCKKKGKTEKQEMLKDKLDNIENEINDLKDKLRETAQELDYRRVIKGTEKDIAKMQNLEYSIGQLYEAFDKVTSKDDKTRIKKKINDLMIKYIDITSKFTYGRCKTMNDALTIIRNCFSHIGRTTIGNEKIDRHLNRHRYIHLTDYDNDNEMSGMVECEYDDILKVLNSPYEEEKQKTLKTQ